MADLKDSDRVKWLTSECGCVVFAFLNPEAKTKGLSDAVGNDNIFEPLGYEIETNPNCIIHCLNDRSK
jgi:hypothetical protein